MNIIGQIIGFIYLILFIISFQFKDKEKLMKLRIISKIFASIHYILIGATQGFISQFLGIFPNYFAYIYEENIKVKKLIVILFSILFIILGIIFYKNIYDILLIVASVITVISLFIKGTKYIRIMQFVISPMFLIYNIVNLSYAGILIEIFVIISCIIGFIRLDNKKDN